MAVGSSSHEAWSPKQAACPYLPSRGNLQGQSESSVSWPAGERAGQNQPALSGVVLISQIKIEVSEEVVGCLVIDLKLLDILVPNVFRVLDLRSFSGLQRLDANGKGTPKM